MPPSAPGKLEVQNVTGVEILRAGMGNGRSYTRDDIANVLSAYARLRDYGYTPTAKLGHNPDQPLLVADGLPNAGQATKLYASADGEALLADVENVPKRVAELMRVRGYGPRSSELWVDQELIPGERFPMALKGFAWLGAEAPALKNLNDIEALYHEAVQPSVYLDGEGHEVTVVALADGETPDDGEGDSGQAVAGHGAMTGTHSHDHPAYGSQGGDGSHDHAHSHRGDANHDHNHPATVNNADASGDKAKSAQQARAKRYGIAVKSDNSNVAKPSQWSSVPESQWGDPVNWRYPMPDRAHANNAAARFAQSKSGYSSKEQGIVSGRISRRQKALGTKAKTENNAEADFTDDEVRAAVQDELAERFPPMMTGSSSGYGPYEAYPSYEDEQPTPCIRDINRAQHWVIVGDWDGDTFFKLDFTIDDACDAVLGDPQEVRITYEPVPTGTTEDLSHGAPPTVAVAVSRQENETMTDEELRTLAGLDPTVDIKQWVLQQRAGTVPLADHQAVLERLTKIESDRNLAEASSLVREMVESGQILPPNEHMPKNQAMIDTLVQLCLSDRDAFDAFKANQPKVVDYSVVGLSGDGVDPAEEVMKRAAIAVGPQAQRDLAKADAAFGLTAEQLAGTQGQSREQRHRAALDEARRTNPALNPQGRELGRVFRSL